MARPARPSVTRGDHLILGCRRYYETGGDYLGVSGAKFRAGSRHATDGNGGIADVFFGLAHGGALLFQRRLRLGDSGGGGCDGGLCRFLFLHGQTIVLFGFIAGVLGDEAAGQHGGSAFHFTLLGRSNRNYSVEFTTDFSGWTNVTNITLSGPQAVVTHGGASNATSRFYRVRLNP